ncbi:MAG: hypothetical protein G01um101420_942 [Parcubacteria group bacterium Gr01-1014_20]|nr:MAG: hypothetical protein G01um101420_942 [Parcubacteria group bacterium Gr01-1014_20]
MQKQVTYRELRDTLGAERECSLSLTLGLQARLYKRRREVPKTDQDGNPTESKYYYQLVVVDVENEEKKVALNRYDRLVYDTRRGEFWVIAGPGSFECPIRNLLTYTTLGQGKILEFTNDDVDCPPGSFSLIHGQAGVSKNRTGRTISGGDLIVIFSGPFETQLVHRRYRIESIVVRNGIDKQAAAVALKKFLGMLLDESGQNGPLQEYFAAEQHQRDEEEAAESAARAARRQAREAAEKTRQLRNQRVTGLLTIIVEAVGDEGASLRQFTQKGQTFRIDPAKNGQPEYSVISTVGGRGLEIVPVLDLVKSGALQAWAESLDAEATSELIAYYDDQLGEASAALPANADSQETSDHNSEA